MTADTSTGGTGANDAAGRNLALTCAQLDGGDATYEARLSAATTAVRRAGARHDPGAPANRLVVLPELWPVGFFHFDDYARSAEPLDGRVVTSICEEARRTGVWVLGGSFVERGVDGLHNTTFLVSPAGEVVLTYRKIHLFGYRSAEPDLLAAGNSVACVRTPFGRVGAMTCYDLRFPELTRALVDEGAEMILVTSAWPAARIEHWRVLLRARAVENQAWIVAANTAGTDAGTRLGGHSAVVAPDGHVVVEGGSDAQDVVAVIDSMQAAALRRELPFLPDRRFGVHMTGSGAPGPS